MRKKYIPILFTGFLICLFLGCEDQPTEPEYDNPLDVANPYTGGDPFELAVEIASGGILLSWNPVVIDEFHHYTLFKMIDDESQFEGVDFIDNSTSSYVDINIENGHRYTYYISLFDDSNFQINSQITEIYIDSDPFLSIDDDQGFTETRNIALTLLAFGAQKMQIGSPELSNAEWTDYSTQFNLELPAGEGIKQVSARFIYSAGDTSNTISDSTMPAPMNPSFTINHDSVYTLYRAVWLYPEASGTNIQCKFAESNDFTGIAWAALDDSISFTLSAGSSDKTVYGIFKNDFEIESAEFTENITPTPINIEFSIDNEIEYMNSDTVNLLCPGSGALEMKFSLIDDSTSVNWTGYQQNYDNFYIGYDEGVKYIYSWFGNDFYAIELSDSIKVDKTCTIESFIWTAIDADTLTAGDIIQFELQMADDFFGAEEDGFATVSLPGGFENVSLTGQGNGLYSLDYEIEAGANVIEGLITANFTDRAGNVSQPFENQTPINILTFWEFIYDGGGSETCRKIIQTNDGGYAVTGASNSSIYLLKITPGGELEFFRNNFSVGVNSYGESLKETADGSFIITGYQGSTPDKDVILIKADGSGNEIWNQNFGGNLDDCGYDVLTETDGGFSIIGSTKSYGSGNSDFWLIRTDSNGDAVWEQTYGGGNYEAGYEFQKTDDDGYIVIGYAGSSTNSYVRLLKIDSAGNQEWGRSYLGSINSVGRSVAQTYDDGYIITGYVFSGNYNVFLIKTDSEGDLIWDETFGDGGDDFGYSVVNQPQGGFALIGTTLSSTGTDTDIWLIEVDNNGSLVSEDNFGGAEDENGCCILSSNDQGLIIAGSTLSFGIDEDVYIIKSLPQ